MSTASTFFSGHRLADLIAIGFKRIDAVVARACNCDALADDCERDIAALLQRQGYVDGLKQSEPPVYLAVYQEYATFYEQMVSEGAYLAYMNARFPAVARGHRVFCRNGCNALWTTEGWDECATCGSVMTHAFEGDYYDALVNAGDC